MTSWVGGAMAVLGGLLRHRDPNRAGGTWTVRWPQTLYRVSRFVLSPLRPRRRSRLLLRYPASKRNGDHAIIRQQCEIVRLGDLTISPG